MRSVVSRIGVRRLTEGNWRSSASGLRHFSDGTGRVLSEEERAKETVYVQKMERERAEKMKKKMEQEKADKDKSDKKAEEYAQKSRSESSVVHIDFMNSWFVAFLRINVSDPA